MQECIKRFLFSAGTPKRHTAGCLYGGVLMKDII